MLYDDFEGSTTKEAIQIGLDKLNIEEHETKIEVIRKEKRGILGIGKKEFAKVRIYYKEKTEISFLLKSIKEIIYKLDQNANISIKNHSNERYHLIVQSLNVSHLIGKRGKTLTALQVVVNSILQKYDNKYRIVIDVDRYNKKKEISLIKWAYLQAKKVQVTKKPIFLKPLNSYDRMLIHLELKKINNISSESKGDGKFKNIKIFYQSSKNNRNY